MEDGKPFVCARCNKSFEKESTHKRHGYYCSSRQASLRVSRKRSCHSCTKAKVRCDTKQPQCSTCETKRVICQYSENVLNNNKSNTMGAVPSPAKASDVTSELQTFQESNGNMLLLPSTSNSIAEPGFLNPSDISGTCNSLISTWDNSEAVGLQSTLTQFEWNSENETSLFNSMEGNLQFPYEMIGQATPESLLDLPDPSNQSSLSSSRSLEPRVQARPGAETSALFLTRILGSYPAMMLRRETFPPFIHAHTENGYGGCDFLPEALVNCMSIAQMFVGRTRETNKFVWRTIRMEQERLWVEHEGFNDWELLASMQALMVYTLMRMAEGPTEHNDFDVPLLTTYNAVSASLAARVGGDERKDAHGDEQNWKEWAFYESRRRLITLSRILDILIDFGYSAPAPAEFALFPLPAKKVLWEAPSAPAWRTEFAEGLRQRELFGLANDGRLMRIRCAFDERMDVTPISWEGWYSEMDAFGSLIMIAASLL